MKTDTKDLTYLGLGFRGMDVYAEYCKLKKCNNKNGNEDCRRCKNYITKTL